MDAVPDAQFHQYAADVGLDGGVADDQTFGDLRVREPLGEQGKYFGLAGCQVSWESWPGRWLVGEPRDETARHARRQQGVSLGDDPNGVHQLACRGVLEQEAAGPAGTAIIQWTCTNGPNQRWTATKLANGNYTLTAVSSGLLLTTASTTDGAKLTQQPNTSSALQQWSIN